MHLSNVFQKDNQSSVSDFLLLEFSEVRELQLLHVFVFMLIYLATLTGNLLIISAVAFDNHLHTPMYFFLMNLAMLDLGSVSVIIPKSVANSLMNTRNISYSGCVAQVLLFVFFAISDFYLLTIMAYDRYVAICNPLQYEMVMNRQVCKQMVVGAWMAGILYAMLHTVGTFQSHFCSNVINQFFCEIPKLLRLACSGSYLIEIGVLGISAGLLLGCFIFIIVTYVQIFTAVLRIPSLEGRKKAFSTCLPHLTVVSIFMISGFMTYLNPPSNTVSYLDLVLTVIYSFVPPILNPVIYSMRNKDIKTALSKLLHLRFPHKKTCSTFHL